jgi:hypothetical protein
MSTEIEKYLKRNRTVLDTDTPDDEKIWGNIEQKLKSTRGDEQKASRRRILLIARNIAASVIIIFSAVYITNDIIKDRSNGSTVSLIDYDLQLGEREAEYRKLVNYRESEIKSFDFHDNEIIKQILDEIRILDQVYAEAMADLKVMGNDDKVVNTIFDTYERKIQLLELIIIETNKTENYEKRNESAL